MVHSTLYRTDNPKFASAAAGRVTREMVREADRKARKARGGPDADRAEAHALLLRVTWLQQRAVSDDARINLAAEGRDKRTRAKRRNSPSAKAERIRQVLEAKARGNRPLFIPQGCSDAAGRLAILNLALAEQEIERSFATGQFKEVYGPWPAHVEPRFSQNTHRRGHVSGVRGGRILDRPARGPIYWTDDDGNLRSLDATDIAAAREGIARARLNDDDDGVRLKGKKHLIRPCGPGDRKPKLAKTSETLRRVKRRQAEHDAVLRKAGTLPMMKSAQERKDLESLKRLCGKLGIPMPEGMDEAPVTTRLEREVAGEVARWSRSRTVTNETTADE